MRSSTSSGTPPKPLPGSSFSAAVRSSGVGVSSAVIWSSLLFLRAISSRVVAPSHEEPLDPLPVPLKDAEGQAHSSQLTTRLGSVGSTTSAVRVTLGATSASVAARTSGGSAFSARILRSLTCQTSSKSGVQPLAARTRVLHRTTCRVVRSVIRSSP